jgi:hypothetical protein
MTSRTRTPGAPSELSEQCALFDWAERLQGRLPELAWLFHVPNGGARAKQTRRGKGGQVVTFSPEAQRLKASGVKPGVPDVFLLEPRGGYAGLVIEMKAEEGRVRPEQRAWLERLAEQHYKVLVCRSWTAAAHQICLYLGVSPEEHGV